MKFFVVFAAVMACTVARPGYFHVPLTYAAAPVVASQYQAQDALGQYHYAYTDGVSSKAESRALDGVTRGGYAYVDSNGVVQNVQYTADDVHGFRVAASNLPVAPQALEQDSPKPVEDTPEVAEARSAHLAAVEEVKARDAAAPADDTESVEVGSGTPALPTVVSYASPASYYAYSTVAGAPVYHTPVYHGVAPAVHAYSFTPVVYSGGHLASELPADDAAVEMAKTEHVAAHVEAKARLVAAGGAVH